MQSFGRVPDLKQTVVGAIGGSKVGSDFVELPQSMSGSPVVNEFGEVSLLAYNDLEPFSQNRSVVDLQEIETCVFACEISPYAKMCLWTKYQVSTMRAHTRQCTFPLWSGRVSDNVAPPESTAANKNSRHGS